MADRKFYGLHINSMVISHSIQADDAGAAPTATTAKRTKSNFVGAAVRR
jgi:hypothetical protein